MGEFTAVPCNGQPSADQVIAAVRRNTSMLPVTVTVTVQRGPLCAGTWQYTVLSVPDRDPLQVVTQGPSGTLQVITAGTDVCTAAVRASAPFAIRQAALCELG